MNISDLRSFFNGSPTSRSRAGEMAEPQHSRTHQPFSGSSPAASYQPSQLAQRGSSVFSNALMSNLQSLGASSTNQPVATTSSESSQTSSSSFFDADEVAKNVLTFVDRAIGAAKSRGASSDKLEEMMTQARTGIEQGFSQAREELGKMGMMNDSLSEGIDKSYSMIGEGLDKIQDNLSSSTPTVFGQPSAGNVRGAAATYQAQMDYSLSKESSLTIKTRDGDEVNISFADITRFQQSHSQTAAYASSSGNGGGGNGGASEAGGFAGLYEREDSMSYYRSLGFSFSVDGDLDEGEQEAISKLVQDIAELADEFFNGDLDKAWQQAQELGFDSSELSGFSLSMQRTESISVRESYSAVAQYGNDGAATEGPNIAQLLKPVDGYIKDFLSMLDGAQNALEDGNALNQLTDSTVGQYLQSQRPDLLEDGLQRFNQFNQNLLGLLGIEQPEGNANNDNPVGFIPPQGQEQQES